MMNSIADRQIVLDTETTGMNQDGRAHYLGHKIVEIGAVEIINRRLTGNHFHVYLCPNREVDAEAFAIHGLSDEFLADKLQFTDVADKFLAFINGAELVIHNASFDVGFLDHEFQLINSSVRINDCCNVIDSLAMARQLFPGKRNSLDALCERYNIDNSHRILHGALLDAEILADVYLTMTGGQTSLLFAGGNENKDELIQHTKASYIKRSALPLKVIRASENELTAHQQTLDMIDKKSGGAIWRKLISS